MANDVSIVDGQATVTVKTTDNAGVHTPHVNVDSIPLPTGAATADNQSTGNISLASIDGKLPALVSSRVPVTLGTAIPAGTNNIGDVDVLSVVPGTGATNLGKAEDAAHASGDTGVMVLAVRRDTPTASSGTTGDYEPLQTNSVGALRTASVDLGTTTDSAATDETSTASAIAILKALLREARSTAAVVVQTPGEYETVAASQTAQTIGSTGASGDRIEGILVIPATTSPGNVLLLDNATSITVFTGGTDSVSNLVPFFIPLGMNSVSGAWKITTGANVSCIAIGNFT